MGGGGGIRGWRFQSIASFSQGEIEDCSAI